MNTLLGNAAKARIKLSWKPKINIHKLIDEMIAEEFKIQESKVRSLLEWYARYKIGVDILCCVEKNGQCYLEGEC